VKQFQLLAFYGNDAIPHYDGARIDAENYFGVLLRQESIFKRG
jgi:hypothetical protein